MLKRTRQLLFLIVAGCLVGCTATEKPVEQPYASLPQFDRYIYLNEGGDTLRPARLQIRGDTLFVAYNGVPRIDLYSPAMQRIGQIRLTDPEPLHPTSFYVADSAIYLVDHSKRALIVTDRTGAFQTSFNMLPDQSTPMSPLAVTFHGGVAYLADIALRRVLAISMVTAPGITEIGELILTIPADTTQALGFPSAVKVTLDGRLLIGDAGSGAVRVFTCDGRFVYSFDQPQAAQPIAPQGFAMDAILDPELQDSTTFDPSMVQTHGRYHVVDGNNARVHMFNPLGRYVASYPPDDRLTHPSDIAIDNRNALIYIADPRAGRLARFRIGK